MFHNIMAIELIVRDLATCTAFYRDTLGLEVLELSMEGGPRVLLAAGVEDVDAAYEALKARGVKFLRPPTDQPWGLRMAYFADPEGNLWEINQPINRKPL